MKISLQLQSYVRFVKFQKNCFEGQEKLNKYLDKVKSLGLLQCLRSDN